MLIEKEGKMEVLITCLNFAASVSAVVASQILADNTIIQSLGMVQKRTYILA